MPKCDMNYCKNKTNLLIYNGKTICLSCKTEWIAEEEEPYCYLCGCEYNARIDEGQYYDRDNEPVYAHEGGKSLLDEVQNTIKYFICGECKIELYAQNVEIEQQCDICRAYKVIGTNSIKNLKNKTIWTCDNCLPKVQTIIDALAQD